ncbi:hypothetical protein [Haladaptatus sp. QDMS2]|uniref:hypothetical protein n=1 Tax=Haladaptatus sp. QDMS2 TaxID=3033391 RepID=UPI0023E8A554|nr:hypothetical protein [Haladaptatus sp. QDMS2]
MIPVIIGALAVGGIIAIGAVATGSNSSPPKPPTQIPIRDDREVVWNSSIDKITDDNKAKKIAASAAITGTSGSILETARRAGIDRHAEAGLVEEIHLKEIARQMGGKVVENRSPVFAPDGGVDGVVEIGEGVLKRVQVKHTAEKVGESLIKQYPDVDVFASSSGFKPNVDLSATGKSGITINDWSVRSKATLESSRIIRGVNRLGAGFIARAKSVMSVAIGAVSHGVHWYLALPVFQQIALGIIVVIAVVGTGYLIWRWYKGSETPRHSHGVSAAI